MNIVRELNKTCKKKVCLCKARRAHSQSLARARAQVHYFLSKADDIGTEQVIRLFDQ